MGFLLSLATVVASPIVGSVGFVMYVFGLWTALAFWFCLGLFMVYAIRRYEKHHHAGYDDRLTDERMDKAREELIRRWKHGLEIENS